MEGKKTGFELAQIERKSGRYLPLGDTWYALPMEPETLDALLKEYGIDEDRSARIKQLNGEMNRNAQNNKKNA